MVIDISAFQSTDFLIPFLFVLAVIFGILEKTNVFRNRGVNFVVALALAFFAVSSSAFVNMLWEYFGSVSVFFIAMFFIAFIFEVFGIKKGGPRAAQDSLIINGIILLILLSTGYLYIDSLPALPFLGGGQNLLLFFAVIFILAIFWAAYKTETPPEQPRRRQ